MNIILNITLFKKHFARIAFLLIFFGTTNFFAQNYRNATAYIADFGKNELYLKESLLEYNKTMTVAVVKDRTNVTLNTIYTKLENINATLLKNDIGYKNDIALRDAFISLNNKTVELFKNNVLTLNDYKEMSKKSILEIDAIFIRNDSEIKKYYAAVNNYEKTKRKFGLKYDIKISSYLTTNILEYNAKENFIFYKISVIDEKYTNLLREEKSEEATACLQYLIKMSDIALSELAVYRKTADDITVNAINQQYIEFIKNRNQITYSFYLQYQNSKKELEIAKKDANLSAEKYNEKVREYNAVKNSYFAKYGAIQSEKQLMIKKFHETNSAYLRKNVQFENDFNRYIEPNQKKIKK